MISRREVVLIATAAIIIPGALIYGEYRAKRDAQLGKANCDAAIVVASKEIRRYEKCKAMMGSFRSLQRWYEKETAMATATKPKARPLQVSAAGSTR